MPGTVTFFQSFLLLYLKSLDCINNKSRGYWQTRSKFLTFHGDSSSESDQTDYNPAGNQVSKAVFRFLSLTFRAVRFRLSPGTAYRAAPLEFPA